MKRSKNGTFSLKGWPHKLLKARSLHFNCTVFRSLMTKKKKSIYFFCFTCLPFRFIQWFVTPLSFWPIKNSSTRFKDVYGLRCLSTVRLVSFHWYFSMVITFLCCVYYVLLAEKNPFFSVSFILLKQQTNKLVTSSTTREGWEFSNCARVVR